MFSDCFVADKFAPPKNVDIKELHVKEKLGSAAVTWDSPCSYDTEPKVRNSQILHGQKTLLKQLQNFCFSNF